MKEKIQCKGIILKNHRLNDNDKIIHILSSEHGPLKAIAKGAYKIKSRFGAKTQVLQFCEFLLAPGRNLHIVQELRLIDQFQNIQKDFDLLTKAYFLTEITDAITLSGDSSSFDYLKLLLEKLDLLNQDQALDHEEQKVLLIDFLWQVTVSQGYKPQLDTCYKTKKRRSSNQIPQYFDFENGSILSEQAYFDYLKENPYENNIHVFKSGVFKVLSELEEEDSLLQSHQNSLGETVNFLYKHLEFSLHHEFKTWKTLSLAS